LAGAHQIDIARVGKKQRELWISQLDQSSAQYLPENQI
jgi:hypothetical protein